MNLQDPVTAGNRALKMYAGRLEKLGIFTFNDFLFHLPARYEDYSLISKIGSLQPGETITLIGQILEIKNQYLRSRRVKTIQKATIADETGKIEILWFNQPFLTKTLSEGVKVSISGKVDHSKKGLSINSPDYEVLFNDETDPIHTARIVPVYPETKGISSKWLRRQIKNILLQADAELEEYLPDEIIKRNNFVDFKTALNDIHFPQTFEDASSSRARLSFDELFLLQLSATKKRREWEAKKKGNKFDTKNFKKDLDQLIASLPFDLTQSQKKSVTEILEDLGSKKPMNRLLQGDVGSGKTIVAAIAMYLAHLNKFQSVLIAPTEILAHQHYETVSKLLTPLGVKVGLRTGRNKFQISNFKSQINTNQTNKEKAKNWKLDLACRQAGIGNLKFDILIGTHAVLHDKVKFDNLGLVVIDEQQRFGVAQRGIIRNKGKNPHLLTMTATPIPRTVALTMYGNLDLSYLSDMPRDRKKVKTWLVPPEKRNSAYDWIKKQISETKSQAFIICPFIEESESMQTVKAAKVEYEKLQNKIFPDLKLGILHGKLKSEEKDSALQDFRKGKTDILVATPVVEVGIDIPNATIIMIEASERFGLAQLHQLRGRVGRGEKQSYCLLFTDNEYAQNSQRLKGMEKLYSGAELAELDLRLRGPGNMYGTAQHGVPKLRAASFSDTALLKVAKDEAERIFPRLSEFPKLNTKIENNILEKISPD